MRLGKIQSILTLLLASALLSACAQLEKSPPSVYSFERSQVFEMNFNDTWTRAVDWFAQSNIVLDKIERDSGLLTARHRLLTTDRYLDCGEISVTGTSLRGETLDRLGSLNVTVRDRGNQTLVNVNFFGEFDYRAIDDWNPRVPIVASGRCESTGELEQSILEYIGQ